MNCLNRSFDPTIGATGSPTVPRARKYTHGHALVIANHPPCIRGPLGTNWVFIRLNPTLICSCGHMKRDLAKVSGADHIPNVCPVSHPEVPFASHGTIPLPMGMVRMYMYRKRVWHLMDGCVGHVSTNGRRCSITKQILSWKNL